MNSRGPEGEKAAYKPPVSANGMIYPGGVEGGSGDDDDDAKKIGLGDFGKVRVEDLAGGTDAADEKVRAEDLTNAEINAAGLDGAARSERALEKALVIEAAAGGAAGPDTKPPPNTPPPALDDRVSLKLAGDANPVASAAAAAAPDDVVSRKLREDAKNASPSVANRADDTMMIKNGGFATTTTIAPKAAAASLSPARRAGGGGAPSDAPSALARREGDDNDGPSSRPPPTSTQSRPAEEGSLWTAREASRAAAAAAPEDGGGHDTNSSAPPPPASLTTTTTLPTQLQQPPSRSSMRRSSSSGFAPCPWQTIRPGAVRVEGAGGPSSVGITGGFAPMTSLRRQDDDPSSATMPPPGMPPPPLDSATLGGSMIVETTVEATLVVDEEHDDAADAAAREAELQRRIDLMSERAVEPYDFAHAVAVPLETLPIRDDDDHLSGMEDLEGLPNENFQDDDATSRIASKGASENGKKGVMERLFKDRRVLYAVVAVLLGIIVAVSVVVSQRGSKAAADQQTNSQGKGSNGTDVPSKEDPAESGPSDGVGGTSTPGGPSNEDDNEAAAIQAQLEHEKQDTLEFEEDELALEDLRRLREMRAALLPSYDTLVPPISSHALFDRSTGQYAALRWIAHSDGSRLDAVTTPPEELEQRFAAAALFFATGGEERATTNTSAPTTTSPDVVLVPGDNSSTNLFTQKAASEEGEGPAGSWAETFGFLGDDDECLWMEDPSLAGMWGPRGLFCDEAGRINKIFISTNGLTGTIPAELAFLPDLDILYLIDHEIGGTIPSALGSLPSATEIMLSLNALTGTIPTELASISVLEMLSLWGNELFGRIPTEIGDLRSLKSLVLRNNGLTGSVPSELGRLLVWGEMELLSVQYNDLTGEMWFLCAEGTVVDGFYNWNGGLKADCLEKIDCDCCTDCY